MNDNCFEPKVRRDPASVSHSDPYPNLSHWDRDTAGVLNFQHILFSLRKEKGVPERFQRGKTVSSADQPQKPTKHLKKSTKYPKA